MFVLYAHQWVAMAHLKWWVLNAKNGGYSIPNMVGMEHQLRWVWHT